MANRSNTGRSSRNQLRSTSANRNRLESADPPKRSWGKKILEYTIAIIGVGIAIFVLFCILASR